MRLSLLAAVASATAVAFATPVVAAAQVPLRSTVFRADSARSVRATAVGSTRSVMDTVTATLARLEAHVTTLAPGRESHAPHRHVDEEVIVVLRGTLETTQEGVVRRAPAGSLIFQASNEMHGLRNAGADTASYYVVRAAPPGLVAAATPPTPTAPAAAAVRPTAALGWLAGCWARQAGARRIEEQWLAPAGGTLLGMSRTTRGDTLVAHEFLRIREDGDTLVYVAMPSGQRSAEFRAAPPAGGWRAGGWRAGAEVVFANPAHDYPQRVRYRAAGRDSLVARIEGTMSGVERGVDFPYRRAACPAGPSR